MYKAKDFDYDLWTSPDGKCFVRVRSTGEVSEISEETMKFLRAEEKRLFREQELKKNLNSDDLRIKTKASMLEQIITVDKIVHVRNYIGRVDDRSIREINNALNISLGLSGGIK